MGLVKADRYSMWNNGRTNMPLLSRYNDNIYGRDLNSRLHNQPYYQNNFGLQLPQQNSVNKQELMDQVNYLNEKLEKIMEQRKKKEKERQENEGYYGNNNDEQIKINPSKHIEEKEKQKEKEREKPKPKEKYEKQTMKSLTKKKFFFQVQPVRPENEIVATSETIYYLD